MNRFIAASLAVGLLGACTGATEEADAELVAMDLPSAPGVRVETATVKTTAAHVDLSFPAQVTASQDSTLAAPMGGYVEQVLVHPGDLVRKGQALARVDTRSRSAQLDIAEAQAEQAQAELGRIEQLGDGASKQQLLAAQTNARIASANAELARIGLQRSVLVAPFSGSVAEVFVEQGEVAGPGAPALRVVRTDVVTLDVSVSDKDIPLLDVGQEVVFRTQSLAEGFQGTLSNIGSAAASKTRTFTVEVEVPNAEGLLRPGMIGRIRFERDLADEAVVIPQDWVVTTLTETGVFIDADGVAEWRPVELDAFARDQVVVRAGLSAGDVVITLGARELAPGDPLIVVRTGVCCEDGRVVW
jgi:RND family efflux transporter MFP subunit